jgi:hypothetical protein
MFTTDADVLHPVLRVRLSEEVTTADFQTISSHVMAWLDVQTVRGRCILMIEILPGATIPYSIHMLRGAQRYANRADLQWILVVTENKLHRLMMTLTLNYALAALEFFAARDDAEAFIRRSAAVGAGR